MMTHTAGRRMLAAALALSVIAAGCGETKEEGTTVNPDPACTGKCDSGDGALRLLSSLSIFSYASADGESESFQLMGEVADDYYFEVEQGQKLSVEIFAVGGADNPDFKIPGEMMYEEDGIGAFASATIDTSLLLPWHVIHVRVFGEHGGNAVDQTFEFQAGETEGTEVIKNDAPIAVLSTLSMMNYTSEAGEFETFALYADVADEYYGVVPDEHALNLEIYAADGASNTDYRINGIITYDADNVGGYTSAQIDTSSLFPWQLMKIRVVGELGGEFVDQTFDFLPGSLEGKPENAEAAPIALIGQIAMYSYTSADGEQESFYLHADVADAYYFQVPDEHELGVEVYAADGASNTDYRIAGWLIYDADAVGGYTTGEIDTSSLLPWMLLRVRVFGELDGQPVDQTFEFLPGEMEGTPVE